MINFKKPLYLIDAVRSPIGQYRGSLSRIPIIETAAQLVQSLLARKSLSHQKIDSFVFGQVLSAGVGQAPARQVALRAGLDISTHCLTLNKVCSSGLSAIIQASMSIELGESKIVIAGGMESMTRSPKINLDDDSDGIESYMLDGLTDVYDQVLMGEFAEQISYNRGIGRREQDAYAIDSYEKAIKAERDGAFDSQLVNISTSHSIPGALALISENSLLLDQDEELKRYNPDKMKSLKPAFRSNGAITAANCPAISDGAAAVLLCSDKNISETPPMARILASHSVSMEPSEFPLAPTLAIQEILDHMKINLSEIDQFEINEAFAVVPMAAIQDLKLDPNKVNPQGGAIAIGHPIGCSGARIVVNLCHSLVQNKKRLGLAAICNGGGEATALLIERV